MLTATPSHSKFEIIQLHNRKNQQQNLTKVGRWFLFRKYCGHWHCH